MRRAFLALFALAACGGGAPPVSHVASDLPTIAFTDPEPPSIFEVPAASMPAALKRFYVLKPDRRFLGAVAEVHRLLTGHPADTVKVSRQGDRWVITYAGEPVGDLPDLPGFEDANAMLHGWAARLLQRYPLDTGTDAAGQDRDTVLALLGQLDVPRLGTALQVVDAGWRRQRHAAWLPLAASGLALLAIQLPKRNVVGDPLVARALATVALAGAAGQGEEDAVVEARTLLAEHMGYTADAAQVATGLPPDHPARLLVARDLVGLRAAATRAGSMPLTRYLYVRATADLGESHDFGKAMEAVGMRKPGSGTMGAAVTTNRFETDELLISLAPQTLAAELSRFTPPSGPVERVVRALRRLFAGRAPSGAVTWADVLQSRAAGGSALADFERDLGALDAQFGGPFLSGELYGLYFRAQLHAAFERACIHYVDGLSSVEGSATFVAAFDSAPPGLWADAARWCRGRAAVIAGRGSVDSLLADLGSARGLSEPALRRSLDDLGDLLAYLDERHAAVARAVFARLDSRPHELRRASQVATDRLGDVPLAERLDERLLVVAAADYPELAVWNAQYRGDAKALAAEAGDRSLGFTARFNALGYLLGISADTAAIFAAFERLLAEDPDNWSERRRYIDMLAQARRPAEAARVASAWLATHGRDRGFDYLSAATALARQYQRIGRLQEAYALLEPLQESYQAGVLERSALIALALGRVDVADRLALAVVGRYPGSAAARITLAEVRWAQHRDEDVPAVLHDPHHPLDFGDWRQTVGPAFARIFGQRPPSEGEAAFDALASAGVPALLLGGIPAAVADSGFFPLALALKQRLLPAVGGNDAEAVEFYRYVVAASGADAGRAWLMARWSPNEARRQSLSIYRNGLYDLLWDLNAVPDDGTEGSYFWLVRALAWLQDPKRDAVRRTQLTAFYRQPDARFYHLAGRCLLSMEPDETLLVFANTPHRRAEVSYYLGIKALSEGRYSDASDWLRVTVETHEERDWEVMWARDLLYRWAATGRELRVAVPRVAATPPKW